MDKADKKEANRNSKVDTLIMETGFLAERYGLTRIAGELAAQVMQKTVRLLREAEDYLFLVLLFVRMQAFEPFSEPSL